MRIRMSCVDTQPAFVATLLFHFLLMYSTILLYMYEARAWAHKQFQFKAKLTRRPAYIKSESRSIPPRVPFLPLLLLGNLSGSVLIPPACLFLFIISFVFFFHSYPSALTSVCCRLPFFDFLYLRLPLPPWPFQCKILSPPDFPSPPSRLFYFYFFSMGTGWRWPCKRGKRKRGYLLRKILRHESGKIREASERWQSKAVRACICECDLSRGDVCAAF